MSEEDADGGTPEDPDGGTPEDPDGETPEDPDGETPEDPDGETPEDPDGETTDDLPDVPEDLQAAIADDDHVLALEDLQYPTLALDEGSVGADGTAEGETALDRDEMASWLEDLAGGLVSHDVAIAAPDGRVTLGVAPDGAEVSFDPGDDGVGDFEVTFRLRAKAMTVADADDPEVGARGGKGFVPLAMLTDDRDPDEFRCYNWVDGPGDG